MSDGQKNSGHPIDNAIKPCTTRQVFAAALLDPDNEIPSGVGKGGEAAPKRFSVYRNNVVVSLMEALQAAYPSLLAIMGEENFSIVARNFIVDNPPSTPLMMQYGRGFPKFLEQFKPLAKSPFLRDVGEAECAWLEAFHARDESVLDPDNLAAVPVEKTMDLTFNIHPAAFLITSQFPVFDLFNARNHWPNQEIDMANGQSMLISRPQFECLATLIDHGQAKFFKMLFDGKTLGDAISAGLEISENFEPTGAIALLLQSGVSAKINF